MKTKSGILGLFLILAIFFLVARPSRAFGGPTFESCDGGQTVVQRIFDGIRKGDINLILTTLDSRGGIAWGGDGVRAFNEVEKDLKSKTGPLYCRLFGCRGDHEASVKLRLNKIDEKQLVVSCNVYMRSEDKNTEWVQVILSWPGKTAAEELDGLRLKHIGKKWYVAELFTD